MAECGRRSNVGLKNPGVVAGAAAAPQIALKMPRNSSLSSPLPPMPCSSRCHDRPSPSRASPSPSRSCSVSPSSPSRQWVIHAMGASLICKCGYVKLWHGGRGDSEMSQHLTDWYTYSHVLHGIIFYWLLSVVFQRPLVGRGAAGDRCPHRRRLGDLREHVPSSSTAIARRPSRATISATASSIRRATSWRCWWASCSPRACRPG